jgi:Domain of unknown function (DUF4157)
MHRVRPLPSRQPARSSDPRPDSPRATRVGGAPLEHGVRTTMEHGFHHDFGAVRVHDDAAAHAEAESLGAAAFAVGDEIVFGAGETDHDVAAGHYLLAHELAHVVQEDRFGRGDGGVDDTCDAEHEARSAALEVVGGGFPAISAAPAASVSREIPGWLNQIATLGIGNAGSPPPAGNGYYLPHSWAGQNSVGGLDVSQSLWGGVSGDAGSLDALRRQGHWGSWAEGSDQRYGFRENVMGGRAALNDSWLGSLLGDDTIKFGADIGAFTAGAEANASPDTGFAVGASANILEGSISGGRQDKNSTTDEWARFGLSAGEGGAARGYWGDADNDGHREYGFGFDAGPVSFDVKTEDPLRTLGRSLAPGLMGGPAMDMIFGADTNLTDSAVGGARSLWDRVPSIPSMPSFPSIGTGLPGLPSFPDIGFPSIGTGFPDLPSLPSLPSIGMPSIGTGFPNLPSLPSLPSIGMPSIGTGFPNLPSLPSLPSIGMPSIGTGFPNLPSLPSIGLPSIGTGLPGLPSLPSLPSVSLPSIGTGLPSLPDVDFRNFSLF